MRNFVDICKRVFLGREGYIKNQQKHIQELLENEGENVLKTLFDLGERENIELTVFFGTLLGAYREKSFIKHDDDIDVVIDVKYLSTNLIRNLKKEGFKIQKIYFSSDFKGCQIPMKYKGLTVDIYVMFKDEIDQYHIYTPSAFTDYDWGFSVSINIFRVDDIKFPCWERSDTCQLNNINVNVPSNTQAVLSALYGEDFMTPKKGAKPGSNEEDIPVCECFYVSYPIDFCLTYGLIDAVKLKHLDTER